MVKRLKAGVRVAPIAAGWHVLSAGGRPFEIYVPRSLGEETDPVPLLVHMHGGVARKEYFQNPGQRSTGSRWVASAEKHGFVAVYPWARADCMWWTEAGAAHVRNVVREAKRLAPIDDDAVVGTGFSDGGSGCFHLAMAEPWPFAAFLPMNGHPAVAAGASGKQLYLRNLGRTRLFATMTQDDQLYPAVTILAHLTQVLREGAPIHIVSYPTGGHRPVYFDDQRGAFERFVTGTARDAAAPDVDWWCASPRLGRAAWVEVLEIGPGRGDANALPDLNVMSTPGRIRLGVNIDMAYEGPGAKVSGAVEDSNAQRLGMKVGDIIVGLDGNRVATLDDLRAALAEKRHGQPIQVAVTRAGKEAVAEGCIPPFVSSPHYRRAKPTARVRVRAAGNTVRVVSRNVRRLRLYLSPDLFADGPVQVQVNGKPAEARITDVTLTTLLTRYAEEADAGRLYTREAVVALGE